MNGQPDGSITLGCEFRSPSVVVDFAGKTLLDTQTSEDIITGGVPSGDVCRVLFASTERDAVSSAESVLPSYDYVFTPSLSWVGWLGRQGRLHFLDATSWRTVGVADAFEFKRRRLSILFPPRALWDSQTYSLYEEALMLGQFAVIDDGTDETYDAAVRDSFFCWILEARNESLHPAFVRAMGHYTIPIFLGWVLLTNMFHNSVVRVHPKRGGVAELLWQLRLMVGSQEDISLAKYQHTIMDILTYHYRASPLERLRDAACILCQRGGRTDLAVVGIYSARRNWAKRAVIRRTWGSLLVKQGIRVQFFLGQPGPVGLDGRITGAMPATLHEDAAALQEDAAVEAEAREFGDVVRLPTPEGYRFNARKGLEFLRYHAEHYPDVEFSIKVDDDVYWRPEGVLNMLRDRVPYRYVWGFLDLNSPVPREEDSFFYHSEELWPDDIFPPYPRGVLRVLSMDVVRAVAAHEKLSMVVTGDDPSLGVHLRQLVLHSGMSLQLDDRGASSRFAMTPTCRARVAYNPLRRTTWVVHHVSARTILCMFRKDEEELYRSGKGPAEDQPDLCHCVDKGGPRFLRPPGGPKCQRS